jgi:hypothetical protein
MIMKLHLTTDSGEDVTITVNPGENVWIDDCRGARIGSLYLDSEGDTLGLGRYSEETAWWEYENPLPA